MQMELLFQKNNNQSNDLKMQNQSFVSFLKPCRYGSTCNKKGCKFQHPGMEKGNENKSREECTTPFKSWLPLALQIKLLKDGHVDVSDASPSKKQEQLEDGAHCYHLSSIVCHVKDLRNARNNSLVTCLRAGPTYHQRSMGSPVNHWYLFNDFTITPIAQEETVWFNFDWKIPCILMFARTDLHEHHAQKIVNPISADVFLEDKTLVNHANHQSITFTPLDIDEMLQKGDVVAMDAEFVTLNQEETVLRSDGTRSTIKPSHMSVARITCIRGQGPLNGTPFIDDYISTQEQVVDYLTKFSGIKPGDLDATISSKHLTTLKSTYLKLRYLIDCGIIFVGHGLKNDFRVINLVVPANQVIDTVLLFQLPHQRMISLRFLAWHFLGLKIQSVTHDSVEDARTALKLYRRYQELEAEGRVKAVLKELYENGRNLQWKVPGMED